MLQPIQPLVPQPAWAVAAKLRGTITKVVITCDSSSSSCSSDSSDSSSRHGTCGLAGCCRQPQPLRVQPQPRQCLVAAALSQSCAA